MKFKKVLRLVPVVLADTFLLASCSGKNSSKDTLKLMQTAEIQSLDNSNVATLPQWNVLVQSMEGLYRMDKNGKPVAAMATKVVKPTNNGKTYTFHIRKDAKWSDGSKVTAQDFVTSWRRSASPSAKSGYNYIFTGIKNATKVSSGELPASDLGVKALNDTTLQVQLEYPMPYFSQMMVMPAFFPQSTKYVNKEGKRYGTSSTRLVYNGPFKVTGWTGTNESWDLTRNKYYYDKKDVHLKKISMQVVKDSNTAHQLFQDNKLDDALVTGTTAQGLQKDKDLKHVYRAGTYYLRLNLQNNKAFQNQKLRQALYLVLNRKQLANKVLSDGSTAGDTYVAPRLAKDPTTNKDFATEMKPSTTYDLKKGQELWNEGLKELNKKKVTLTLVTDDQTISKNVGQFVQSQVETKLKGAEVDVVSVPDKSANDKVSNGNFDMNYTLWLADFADPISDFDVLSKTNPQNYGKYASEYYNKQLELAKQNGTDTNKYWENMRNMQKQLNDDMPVVPLYTMTESHLVNSNLKGVMWHSVGETDYTRAYFGK